MGHDDDMGADLHAGDTHIYSADDHTNNVNEGNSAHKINTRARNA